MGDLPHAAGLAQTQRVTEPNIGLRTVGAAPRQVDQRVAKRDVFAGGDAKLRDRESRLASPAGESSPLAPADHRQRFAAAEKIELNPMLVPARC